MPLPLDPALWPSVWHSVDFVEQLGTVATSRNGARVTVDKQHRLTYHCTCGSTITRARQDLIPEVRDWIESHTPHLPPEEQIEP